MTPLLRKQPAQAGIEGRERFDSGRQDYAVVEDTVVGRICRETFRGRREAAWFSHYVAGTIPGGRLPSPKQGMADNIDSLEEAKAAFAKRYEQTRRGK